MEFVVPTLNEGLLEVSNIIPNDPVDLLAEYLYQKSYDVWVSFITVPNFGDFVDFIFDLITLLNQTKQKNTF